MFLRYQPAIATILSNWPAMTILDPAPYAVETVACRLRDAITSVLKNNWPSSTLPAAIKTIGPLVVVSSTLIEGRVCAGPANALKKDAAAITVPSKLGLQVKTELHDVIHALSYLHHQGILIDQTTIETHLDVAQIASSFDVYVENTQENIWTIT
jgi:hypothetical protein